MNKKAQKILNTTIKLFIRDGIKKITMDDIAENANVSKVTIYKYFTDKDALYLHIAKHIFSQYIARLETIISSNEVLIKKLYDYLDVISDFTDSGQFELCGELSKYNDDIGNEYEIFLQKYKLSMLALIDEGIESGLIKKDLDREMIFHYIDMGVVYYQKSPAYRDKILNDVSYRQQFMLFYINNIFTDGAKILSGICKDVPVQNVLQKYLDLAKEGTEVSIGEIMKHLDHNVTLLESKFIDFALGQVESDEGVKIMEYYLFHGTPIQRNYCALYFGRRGEYNIVRKAYDAGLIDAKQAFSR